MQTLIHTLNNLIHIISFKWALIMNKQQVITATIILLD
jgi:hypothetical protein